MGIAKGAVKVLLKETARKSFKGSVLTLGKQDVFISYPLLQKLAKEFGVQLSNSESIELSPKSEFAAKNFISDTCLLKSLGFSECNALDYSSYESANHIFDLNSNKISQDLQERFDVILDGGCIEHTFHIPNVLNNLYNMLRPEGRIIHISPSSNYMDHGFYMFSPTFFWDFYTTNKFEINSFQLIRHTRRPDIDPWEISNYQPGCLNKNGVSFGGLDDSMYAIVCIVTKAAVSTGNKIPQQSLYAHNIWKTDEDRHDGISLERSETSGHSSSIFFKIKEGIKRLPWLYRVLFPVIRIMRLLKQYIHAKFSSKGLGLKIINRY